LTDAAYSAKLPTVYSVSKCVLFLVVGKWLFQSLAGHGRMGPCTYTYTRFAVQNFNLMLITGTTGSWEKTN